jgi:arsenite methyltransferase
VPPEVLQRLHDVRDRVLDNAELQVGDLLLDIGCGDGLIGFGALDRTGDRGHVIFSDISSDLVERCRNRATALSVIDRCRFMVASATTLPEISEGRIDVVTTRSVLIYVDDKLSALKEFFRVLRPGGRISIGEPINQFTYPEPPAVFLGYDLSAVRDLADKLETFFDREERPRISAMMDFNERDLLDLVEQAGFREIRLDLRLEVKPTAPQPWDRFLHTAGNPLSPTMNDAFAAALTPDERARFEAHLKPMVESGAGTERRAFAFLKARKPDGSA